MNEAFLVLNKRDVLAVYLFNVPFVGEKMSILLRFCHISIIPCWLDLVVVVGGVSFPLLLPGKLDRSLCYKVLRLPGSMAVLNCLFVTHRISHKLADTTL